MKCAPSHLSVSKAYSISPSVASTSGSGRAQNKPKRVGCCCTSLAPYSLHSRAITRVASLSPNHRPGLVIEIIAVATPPLSMSSIDFSGAHPAFAGWRSSRPLTKASHCGGEKWWWTSMRRGFVAEAPCAKLGIGAPLPARAAPNAARPPVTNARRSTGEAIGVEDSPQHAQWRMNFWAKRLFMDHLSGIECADQKIHRLRTLKKGTAGERGSHATVGRLIQVYATYRIAFARIQRSGPRVPAQTRHVALVRCVDAWTC